MKISNIANIASVLLASLVGASAATTLTAWNFDNAAVGLSASPSPSTGLGVATAVGMGNSYNSTNSVSNPDVQSLSGSSTGGANSWRIRGYSTQANQGGNGWSTNAPIGTQGAQFTGSTFGYYQVQASFDVYATADSEANLQVQYSTDGGTTWFDAPIASPGTGTLVDNTAGSDANTVHGTYVKLASGWNNQITVNLSGVSGVDNNAGFAVRFVNASTGASCVDTTGAIYNNASGSWTFDNVVIQGASIDTIVQWTFDSYPSTATIITNPVPEIGGASAGKAKSLGFNNNYTYSGTGNGTGSTDASDVTSTGGSSSGNVGPNAWRVRGARLSDGTAGIGWNTAAPIGTQGAEFDASTAGYSNIVVAFDLYFTSAAPAKMCVLYTTDGWTTTNVASKLFYGPKPGYILTNDLANGGSANTVDGIYFYETAGQNFYNNIIVDFTGVPGVENNPQFGFRIVNAATSFDCVNNGGTAYNNSSGNWRFDNITVGGTAGTPPPALAIDPNASVDASFTNTFTENADWRSKITGVYVNGQALPSAAYNVSNPGMIIFTPSYSVVLQASGLMNISIFAQGYGTAKIGQPLVAGVATHLAITTQAAGPSASGGTLVANPVLAIADQYNNSTTNPYANVSVTASAGGAAGWTLGGDVIQAAVSGVMTFSNLTAKVNGSSAVNGALITFTVTGYPPLTVTNSASFTIGAPAANFTRGNLAILQLDKSANNTTFSIIEINPSVAGQTKPVNVIPISATGTNALRMSSAGSCGKLSLSDDGTLLCFAAFADDSAATPDETFNLNRAAVGLNYTNQLVVGLQYVSTSLGGSQARSCTTLDGVDWIADDKGGLYEAYNNTTIINEPNVNAYNNVVVKAFGGVIYVETQKTVGPSLPVLYYLGLDPATELHDVTPYIPGLVTDANAGDFYMISTNGGTSYDVLYILDQNSASNGAINKYSRVSGAWVANGSFTNATGGDSLFATTNGNGSVYLYLTTAPSGGVSNSVVRFTDASGWNAPINIVSTNVLYTAPGGTYLKGITFVPQQTAYAVELTPAPVLIAQTGAKVSSTFTVTNTPDDPAWRSAITGITVNGTTLPAAAYNKTQAGKIVFDPSQSSLLQAPGAKVIVISATGYSTNSATQTLVAGTATQLVITAQPAAPLGNGGILTIQPKLTVKDTYGNVVTNNISITNNAVQNTWTLGGAKVVTTSAGVATFAGLTAFSTSAVSGATMSFTSGGMTATSQPFNIPAPIQSVLGSPSLIGGQLTFAFTNVSGLSFSVLGTNNLMTPSANWPVVGNAVENPPGSGNYQFTDSNPPTNGSRFYLLRQP
jgi:hypothetical protein